MTCQNAQTSFVNDCRPVQPRWWRRASPSPSPRGVWRFVFTSRNVALLKPDSHQFFHLRGPRDLHSLSEQTFKLTVMHSAHPQSQPLLHSSCLSVLNRFQAWIAIWRCFWFFLKLLFLSLPLSFPNIYPNKSFAHLFFLASVSLRPLTNIDSSRNSQRKQVARWGLGSGSLIKRLRGLHHEGYWDVDSPGHKVGAPRAKDFTSGE